MLIKYIGHACFKVIDEKTEYSVIFDPYENGYVPGLSNIDDQANLVLCSHGHGDHDAVDAVTIAETEGVCPFKITEIDSFHDESHGAERGRNLIRILDNGKRVIHYGDLGMNLDEILTEENSELLKDADIAFIPVGDVYTINGERALELIRRTNPVIAVPMHYKSVKQNFGFDVITDIDDFVSMAESGGFNVKMVETEYRMSETEEAACILVMKPCAAE